jgi:hypothetical protein
VQGAVRQLLHIDVVDIEELPICDYMIAVGEVEEVSGGDTVDLIERNVLAVPPSVE